MTIDSLDLKPGDALLYFSRSLFDTVIALKTWTEVAHIEVFVGNGLSVASRNGLGVNVYSLRRDGLVYVRRPSPCMGALDFDKGHKWFKEVQGEKYDWLGLLCFTLAVSQGAQDRMFCSEFATRYYRACGGVPFDANWDADKVSPGQFMQTPAFYTQWRASGL